MTLPNQLTLGRLGLTAVFVAAMSVDFAGHYLLALVAFLAAVVTDWMDGWLARRLGQVTEFGKLMDPLIDKILTASAFVLLVDARMLPAWVVIVIIGREFLITGLRLLAGARGEVLPAEKLGKHKTAWQMVTIVYFLVLLACSGALPAEWERLARVWGGNFLVLMTTLLTAFSGLAYLWKHRRLIAVR